MSVRPVGDLRRYVAHVSHGALAMLIVGQEALDDIEGGVPAGQWDMVAAQTRHLVMACLHVLGLAAGAEAHFWEDTTAGDMFAGVPEEEIGAALRLLDDARGLPGPDPAAWLQRVRAFVAMAEDSVQLAERLPELRSPEGMFGGLRLVRGWQPLVAELSLPPLLPGEWTKPL